MKILIFLVTTILLLPTSSFSKDTLSFGQPIDPISEISCQVLEEAYKRIHYNTTFIELPAERSLAQSQQGSLDGEANRVIGIDNNYDNLIRVPVPINFFEAVVFTKNQNFAIEGWDSLKPYTVAIRIGSKFIEKESTGLNITKFPTYEKIFMLVSNDRYDICVASRVVGLYQIKNQHLKGIKALEPPLATTNLYHYLHKKHKDLVPKITAALIEMEKEGRIKEIRGLYIKELLKSDTKMEEKE